MKRFTATEKWRDPWYRKLTPAAKHLMEWMLDHCDRAGVLELDLEAAGFDIGERIGPEHLEELTTRVETLPNGKILICRYVHFQFGELSESCPPHRSVLALVRMHGIERVTLDYRYPSVRVVTTLQDKDKEKDKEKEEGIVKGRFQKPTRAELDLAAAKIGLPSDQVDAFVGHYESNGWKVGRNPMRSWPASLGNWQRNWRAGTYRPNGEEVTGQTADLNDPAYVRRRITESL